MSEAIRRLAGRGQNGNVGSGVAGESDFAISHPLTPNWRYNWHFQVRGGTQLILRCAIVVPCRARAEKGWLTMEQNRATEIMTQGYV